MSKLLHSIVAVIAAIVLFLVIVGATFGWAVFQWQQCRHNPNNTFWFCVGHL